MEYDFFDLIKENAKTKVYFDLSAKEVESQKADTVKKAIDEALDELKNQKGNAGGRNLELRELNRMIAFLEQKSTEFFNEKGDLSDEFRTEAEAKTKREIENFKNEQKLKQKRGSTISPDQRIFYEGQYGLSKSTILKVLTEFGIDVYVAPSMPDLPPPSKMQELDELFEKLKAKKDTDEPEGVKFLDVWNIYQFLACFEKKPNEVIVYQKMETESLKNLCIKLTDPYKGKIRGIENDYKLIFSKATTIIFNQESSRTMYDRYILYRHPSLLKIYGEIKKAYKGDLKNKIFANDFIERITAICGDSEFALAIYNREAGFKDDECYIPSETVFKVFCGNCCQFSDFKNREEAQSSNQCGYCGKPLYKKCDYCKSMTGVSEPRCPECGYIFAQKADYPVHISNVEKSLKQGDIVSAKDYLMEAKKADPSKTREIAELEKRIKDTEVLLQKPIDDLKSLVNENKFVEADKRLRQIAVEHPSLNLQEYRTKIDSVLGECRKLFNEASSSKSANKAAVCWRILDRCVDYTDAVEFFRKTPPSPASGFRASVDHERCVVSLRWDSSPEERVTYRLIRKEGKTDPINENDGKCIKENVQSCSCNDVSVQPGTWYTYALFVSRIASFSTPVTTTALVLRPAFDIGYTQSKQGVLHVTWKTPPHCEGVDVTRKAGKEHKVIANNVLSGYVDDHVEPNVGYTYYFIADYGDLGKSHKSSIFVTPTVIVDRFSISARKGVDDTYSISWSIPNNVATDLQIFVDGKLVQQISSTENHCLLDLAENTVHRVYVNALSGGKWIRSQNELNLNTYKACKFEITEEIPYSSFTSRRYSTDLVMKIQEKGEQQIKGFYYFVQTANTCSEWPKSEKVGEYISWEQYEKDGEIKKTITNDHEKCFISIWTVYRLNGEDVVSAPFEKEHSRLLVADIEWECEVESSKQMKLSLNCRSRNRTMSETPPLVLRGVKRGSDFRLFDIKKIPSQPLKTHKMTVEMVAKILSSYNLYEFMKFDLCLDGEESEYREIRIMPKS